MRKLALPITALMAGVAVLAALTVGRTAIHSQLTAWKVLPQAEQLSQLYFTSPGSIPATYTPGRPQPVGFTVRNLGTRATVYAYQISEQSSGAPGAALLAQGSFTLAGGQKQSPIVSVAPKDLGPRVLMVVKLQNESESIDYWVTRSSR